MHVPEHSDDEHGDYDALPLAVRMRLLADQADPEHIAAWAEEVEASTPRGAVSLTTDQAATAATLVDLMKRNLPPHISEAQQVETYRALKQRPGAVSADPADVTITITRREWDEWHALPARVEHLEATLALITGLLDIPAEAILDDTERLRRIRRVVERALG